MVSRSVKRRRSRADTVHMDFHVRGGFTLRLLLSVAIAFASVGIAAYVVIGLESREQLLEEGVRTQRAEAESLRRRAENMGPKVQSELSTIVREIGAQPDSLSTEVLDPRGTLLARSGARTRKDLAGIARAFETGRAAAALLPASAVGPERFRFVAPVQLPAGEYVLVIERSARAYRSQLTAVRHSLLVVGIPGGFAALGLVWLLGGSALSARHRSALERATQDGLTDLGNHRAFQDELGRAMATADRGGGDFGLVVLDVDDLKFANDRHGHQHGDEVLRRVARSLQDTARLEDRTFRLGGDEFALLLPRVTEADATAAATRMLRALGAAGVLVSAGVSATRPGMHDPRLLREEADAALYEAKARPGPGPVRYSEIRDDVALLTPDKVDGVRRLLEEGALEAAFQPIWDLSRPRLLGVEGLARPAAEYGLAGPAEAFEVAEQIGRVRELDVLCASRIFAAAAGLPEGVLLFVNATPFTLDAAEGELDWFRDAALEAGLDPGRVVIEITERMGGRLSGVVRGTRRLRELGFQLALDDVGAGDAGLVMLRSFGVDFVKVDRSVVAAAPQDAGSRAVLSAVAAFAHETGAFVIAEGIEDTELLAYVRGVGAGPDTGGAIRGGQGYGLGRPAGSLAEALKGATLTALV